VDDLLEANRIVLDKLETSVRGAVDKESRVEFKVVIEKGATVKGSVIRARPSSGRAR